MAGEGDPSPARDEYVWYGHARDLAITLGQGSHQG